MKNKETKLKNLYPAMGGCCIGVGVGLLAPSIIIAGVSAGLIIAGILFLIYYYK